MAYDGVYALGIRIPKAWGARSLSLLHLGKKMAFDVLYSSDGSLGTGLGMGGEGLAWA